MATVGTRISNQDDTTAVSVLTAETLSHWNENTKITSLVNVVPKSLTRHIQTLFQSQEN